MKTNDADYRTQDNKTVESLEDYIKSARRIRDQWDAGYEFWKLWFRGQCCESWDLKGSTVAMKRP